jgi:hypothetical protein
VRPGPCSSGHMVLKRAPWGLSVRPLGSEELSLVRQSAPMLQTPSSPLPLLLRRGVACSARGQSSAPPFRRGVGCWPGTSAAGYAVPPRRAGGAGTWHVSAPPKGRGLTSSSRWSGERRRASPSLSTVPLGITLPKMGERFASRGFLSLKNPGRSAEAGLSGLHPLSWRRNAGRVSTGALRGRSVRAEARRCCPGAAVVFPSGPKAFWVPALPKLRWADTRSTEVVRVAAEDGRAEARAFVSFSRAEARGGESPFAGRSPRGRGESLSLSQQQAAGSREGTFPRSQNAPGRRFRSEKKLESIP